MLQKRLNALLLINFVRLGAEDDSISVEGDPNFVFGLLRLGRGHRAKLGGSCASIYGSLNVGFFVRKKQINIPSGNKWSDRTPAGEATSFDGQAIFLDGIKRSQ